MVVAKHPSGQPPTLHHGIAQERLRLAHDTRGTTFAGARAAVSQRVGQAAVRGKGRRDQGGGHHRGHQVRLGGKPRGEMSHIFQVWIREKSAAGCAFLFRRGEDGTPFLRARHFR
jgi:hypothetical protein